jgi:hypothetical protein
MITFNPDFVVDFKPFPMMGYGGYFHDSYYEVYEATNRGKRIRVRRVFTVEIPYKENK